MQLSVVIVNYNVKHFLEQCLCSVVKAIQTSGSQGEVIVIDNHSADNSINYLEPLFPCVRFIENNVNAGFSRACNQGFQCSKGEYVLFLNPDTIIPENCFSTCISFFETHADAGALGVKMLDGSGKFLRESKRGFPSPARSLFRLSGLAAAFPRSKLFAGYYCGHLSENQTHEVDVLAGAFIMVRRTVLQQLGGFDEIFFMYGEDVDLSYRIQNIGYKNYYVAATTILHFKGESARKGSLHYLRMFYGAMSVFVSRHYTGGKAYMFNFFLHIAIWFRAALSAAGKLIKGIGLPVIDVVLIVFSFWIVKECWSTYVRPDVQYPAKLLLISFPIFALVYTLVACYAGLYDKWYRRAKLIRSTIIATLVLLAGYALLPERFRFSRAIVLFGAILVFILISLTRWLLLKTGVLQNQQADYQRTLIIGSDQEFQHVQKIMEQAGLHEKILGRVSPHNDEEGSLGGVGRLRQLKLTTGFRELIFCEGVLSFGQIIAMVESLPKNIQLKFHASMSQSIVGSRSKNAPGEAVSGENTYRISDPYNKRIKRLLDVIFSALFILTFPIHFIFQKQPVRFFANCFQVLAGRRSWVGYAFKGENLPTLRPPVIGSNALPRQAEQQWTPENLIKSDELYAKDYQPLQDLKIIWKCYRELGA